LQQSRRLFEASEQIKPPMETLVERPAPGEGKHSGATSKNDAGDAGLVRGRGRPSSLALFQDLIAAFKAPGFWLYGAWIDTTVSYRSQALGAFWMVAGTVASVVLLGALYSRVLKHNSEIYYAHIGTGYVLWAFIQQALQRSARVFKDNISMIQNGYVRYVDYVLRLVGAQLINLGYNLIVVIGAIALTPVNITIADLALFLTVPLFLLAVLGVCFFLSIVGARYQDVSELMRTVLRLFFFITPIIWMPSSSGKGALIGAFIYANPFYYLVEIIRGPLVYSHIPWFEIGVVLASIPMIWLVTALAYARAKPFIPLWI
jgi:homopolymeric O-antigen transport system permease protein